MRIRLIVAFCILFLSFTPSAHSGTPLKADIATAILVGPFLDKTDGVTAETAFTVTDGVDCDIYKFSNTHPRTKTDITLTAAAGNNDMAHVANGYYSLELTAGNLDTEGTLVITVNSDATFLPVVHDFVVVNANVYDSLYAAAATDYLQTDVIQYNSNGVTATVAGIPDVNVTYWEDDAVPGTADGYPAVNVDEWDDTDVSAVRAGHPEVNVIYYNASTAIFSIAGYPDVNVTHWEDSAVTDADGQPDVDVVSLGNNVITSASINDGAITDADVANDVQVDVVTIETGDATDALDTACNTVTVTSIGNDVITSASIADGGITDADVANDLQVDVVTIETGDATDALDTACNTVTVTSIGNDVVTAAAIANDAIGAAEIAANAIADSELAADVDTLVNDEVADVLKTDTVSEMAQGAPSGTPSMEDILNYLYRAWRNQVITSASSQAYYNDAANQVLFRNPVTDDGNEFTKGEVVTGP